MIVDVLVSGLILGFGEQLHLPKLLKYVVLVILVALFFSVRFFLTKKVSVQRFLSVCLQLWRLKASGSRRSKGYFYG